MVATHFFGKRYKNRGFREFWKRKNRFLEKKEWNYFLPVLKAPHFLGVTFCFGLSFFFFFFLFLLHLARGCAKKPYFYRVFWHTLLKHLVTIMQQQWSEAKTHQKKGAIFFQKTLFWPNSFSRNTNLAPPPHNCAPKNLPKPLFL